jgi:hypothetical protein
MESRRDVAALLESMMDEEPTSSDKPTEEGVIVERTQDERIQFHRRMKSRRSATRNRRIKRREDEQARDAWVMDALHCSGMGEGSEFVCFAYEWERRRSKGRAVALHEVASEEESLSSESEEEDSQESTGHSGASEKHRSDDAVNIDDTSHLVFSLESLPSKLSHLIANYPPQAYPLSRRTLPANGIFLLARYAAYHAVDDNSARANLAGLLETVMLEIERVCLVNVESLPHLAFWLYNTTILLHLVQSDRVVHAHCQEEDLCLMVEDMINSLQGELSRCVKTAPGAC